MPTITANSASNAVLDVLRATYKTIYIPFVDAGREIGLAKSSSRNMLYEGRFPLPTIKIGVRRMVSIFALAEFLTQQSPKPAKRGPRFKKDRLAEQGRA
jgi:hypothetical protein